MKLLITKRIFVLLSFIVLLLLFASLQKECLGGLHPAYISKSGMSKVKEKENVTFHCKADLTDRAGIIKMNMYLSKNCEIVNKKVFKAVTRDDITFHFIRVTVEHSGLYTCHYSDEKLNISKTTATGKNSVSLEVLGKLLPAKIAKTETPIKRKEHLTLTCTFTKIPKCTQLYVYLCFNGIGSSKKQVNCSDITISTTFLLSNAFKQRTGNYSCVYSVSNYNLSEVNSIGENTIHVSGDFSDIMPANISVMEIGPDLEIKCTIPASKADFKQIYMYLCKSGNGLRMKLLRAKNEHTFILEKVSEQDSGIYSCVYSLQKHDLMDLWNTGQNTIQVHIYGLRWEINLLRLIFSIGVIVFGCCIVIFDFMR